MLITEMKKYTFLVFIFVFTINVVPVKSQCLSARETLDYINAILKTNPFVDTFNEITFYQTIDITKNNELEVRMDFNGPFKSIARSNISDLDLVLPRDSCIEISNSICWNCKAKGTTGINDCVYNENIYTGGEKEIHASNNICIMFSNQNSICEKLNVAFDCLFKKVLEAELKN
jgi:hypothetical protein